VAGSSTSTLYDGFDPVQTSTGGSTVNRLPSRRLDESFASNDATSLQVPLVDALGSIVALTDASGNVTMMEPMSRPLAAATFAACISWGCSVPEPGISPREPSPLFDGYQSYRTLDEVKARLPDRSDWRNVHDMKSPARGRCPKFYELTFAVPTEHFGYKGELQLTFINDRLQATSFTPQDFPAYLEALRRSGIVFQADGQATIPPATRVWQWQLSPRFIGWDDERLASQVSAWVSSCA
jgi:hypothetical protein